MLSTKHQPGPHEFEAMARKAFTLIPPPFAQHLRDIVVRVEDFADASSLKAVGLDNPWQLSGLYHGQPLDKQSIWTTGDLPPVITLYRKPLLREWQSTGIDLQALVSHVVIHEVGHHFGLSDADMESLERGAR